MKKTQRYEAIAVLLILLCGAALRIYRLSSVPYGLHRDEMSEIYEAYSLLKTGADRWGYRWPVYFLSWGSGQNVLQSYLSIPVVATLGLTAISTRFIPALFGVLLLPLFYVVLRRWYGFRAALVGLIIVAFSPWHIMLSRWGVENNQLPFFILLGLYLFRLALDRQSKPLILCSLLPFGLALYSYGVFVVILPVLLLLLIVAFYDQLRVRWKTWLSAFLLFATVSVPIAFFTFKNYIAKRDFAFERYLPCTVPYMRITRLAQARGEVSGNLFRHNLGFAFHLFRDPNTTWYNVPPIPPLPRIVLLLTVVGIVTQLNTLRQKRRYRDIFGLWLLACVPLFFLFPLNISRAIALFLPLIALAAIGFDALLSQIDKRSWRIAVAAGCGVAFLLPTLNFIPKYFGRGYAAMIAEDFRPEMPMALAALNRLSASRMPMYVTNQIWLPYVDVLYYEKIPPATFQQAGATWFNPDFGRYRFNYRQDFQSSAPFAFLLLSAEPPICNQPANVERIGRFTIGTCDGPGSHSIVRAKSAAAVPTQE